MEHTTADVLVLGAGAAGLAAAHELSRAGLRVCVVEARGRVGGRIFTERVPGHPLPIELGAEFIHGRPPESLALAAQAGLLVYAVTGEGWLAQGGRLSPSDDIWERTDELLTQMPADGEPDHSFEEFLAPFRRDPAWRDAVAMAVSYVEGFDAADASLASVQALVREQQAAAANAGHDSFRIAQGYDKLVAALLDGCPPEHVVLHLGTVARRVTWRPGEVAIEADGAGGARTFRAPRAVLTLPLGVLQASPGEPGAVVFDPPLAQHADAARRLMMGDAARVTLRFRERFWESERLPLADASLDPSQLSFLFGREVALPTWWTAYPALAPQLTAWAGGPAAARLAGLSKEELVERALASLAQLLGIGRGTLEAQLVGAHSHNWHADPFARGAYSYIPVGGIAAVRALAAPVEGTLFFAGEATNDDGNTGTVHGAIATGRRAAREVLDGRFILDSIKER